MKPGCDIAGLYRTAPFEYVLEVPDFFWRKEKTVNGLHIPNYDADPERILVWHQNFAQSLKKSTYRSRWTAERYHGVRGSQHQYCMAHARVVKNRIPGFYGREKRACLLSLPSPHEKDAHRPNAAVVLENGGCATG
jgi:hypothetical protein